MFGEKERESEREHRSTIYCIEHLFGIAIRFKASTTLSNMHVKCECAYYYVCIKKERECSRTQIIRFGKSFRNFLVNFMEFSIYANSGAC